MSGSRWVITPLWLSGSLRSFLYSSSVYICQYLLLLLGPYRFCPLLYPSLHEMFPWYLLIFLKRSLVFPILLFSFISLHCSLRKAFLSFLAIYWIFLMSLLFPSTSSLFSCCLFSTQQTEWSFKNTSKLYLGKGYWWQCRGWTHTQKAKIQVRSYIPFMASFFTQSRSLMGLYEPLSNLDS